MSLHTRHGLDKVVIEPIDRVLLACCGRAHKAFLLKHRSQRLAQRCVVGDTLGNNVACAGKSVLHIFNVLLGIDVLRGKLVQLRHIRRLCEDRVGKRLKTLFLRDGGACAALGLVRTVQILDLGERFRVVDGSGKLLRELALLLNRAFDSITALLKRAQIRKALLKRAERRVVHRTVKLLAVTRDKGDGITLVEQLDHSGNMRFAAPQFPGDNGNNRIHNVISLSYITCGRTF